jgi:pSer/pThr/pTyr-binding forkhead associated (FHA) protein
MQHRIATSGGYEAISRRSPDMTAQLQRFCLRIERGAVPCKELVTDADRVVIGSSPQADLVIEDEDVSSLHCEVARDKDGFVLRDLGSEKGTWLSGARVREVVLPPQARFELGVAIAFGPETPHAPTTIDVPFKPAKAKVVSAFELEYLTAILARHNGNITASAHAAELDRVHFLRLLDRYGLRKTKTSSRPPKGG